MQLDFNYIYIAAKQYCLKRNSLNSRGPFQIFDSLLFLSLASPQKDKHGNRPKKKTKKSQWKPPRLRSPGQLRGDVAIRGSRGESFASLDPDDDEGFDQARPWWYTYGTGMWCLVDETTVYVSCC